MATRACALLFLAAWPARADWINPGTPGGVPQSFDCAVRQLALDYGKKLLPNRGSFKSLFDALQLENCPDADVPKEEDKWAPPMYATPPSGPNTNIFVDYAKGSDSNLGGEGNPLKTIAKALEMAASSRNSTILLRGGVHIMESRAELDASHSGVTIQNYNGERAVVSGGKAFSVPASAWEKYSVEKRLDAMLGYNNVYGRAQSEQDTDTIKYLGKVDSLEACYEKALSSDKGPFTSITWHSNSFKGEFSTQCFGITDGYLQLKPQDGVDSGVIVNRNVWKADLSSTGIKAMPGLRRNGRRAIRAKFPNGNPEDSGLWLEGENQGMGGGDYVKGWITWPTDWVPPAAPQGDYQEIVMNATDWPSVEWPMQEEGGSTWTGEGDWGEYHYGFGGYCNRGVFPPAGYWCAKNAPRHITVHQSPDGVVFPRAKNYSNPEGAVINAWRGGGRWYTFTWNVTGFNAENNSLAFDPSTGNQGGEGVPYAGQWWIENVIEELDSPDEWFFDAKTQTLYYQPNGTFGQPPSGDEQWVATQVQELFRVTGDMKKPASDITIQGIEMRDTAVTYLEPHGLPSGGDWALQRTGVVRVEGVERFLLRGSLLSDIDGIGVSINGYTRNVTIDGNEFLRVGESAMASWGYTSTCLNEDCSKNTPYKVGPDGRGGEQPRGTTVSNNLVREIGIWQKQSSMWFQAVTAGTNLVNNVHFNGPRAGINLNDGFGGGDVLQGNLVLNCVRESGDHGPYNSWDRVPYITLLGSGKPSIIPAWREIRNNFMIGVYASQEVIDTDDGSSYYKTHDNFFVYAGNGLKSDFGGHDNRHFSNVYAYVSNCYGKGNNDWFVDNQCIANSGTGGFGSDCSLDFGMQVYGNTVYNSDGSLGTKICNTTNTVAKWPSDKDLIAMGKAKIGM